MQNIETAQRGIVGGIRIELEWYDENELDIERLFNELSVREDVDAVIGPFYSEHTWVAARQCAKLCYNNRFATLAYWIFTLVGTGGPALWHRPFPDR